MLSLETLGALATAHGNDLKSTVAEFSIGGVRFAPDSRPAIMGVVNLSPDSWYRESVCLSVDAAIARGRVCVAQGAHVIDVGAESSLAQAALVDDAGQLGRLLPVVRGLAESGAVVSVETYRPDVARACFAAGARILNLTGTAESEEMFRVVADHDGGVVICHVQGANVREVSDFDFSADTTAMMKEFFSRQIETAARNGVGKIFIDPGLGFYYRNLQDSALRVRHQMSVFLNTFRLRTLGFPTCHALPHAFEFFGEEVRSAEAFFCVLAALGKTDLFRTHEVPRIKAVLDTMAAF